MEPKNNIISVFLLLGYSEDPKLQTLIYRLFLSMYLTMVLRNLLILLAIVLGHHLHMPMYFFLHILAFVDICFTSMSVPKMLVNIQTQSKPISYPCCILRFLLLFAGLDDFILAAMSYECFMSIGHPLPYRVMMGPWLCVLMVVVSSIISALHALLHGFMVMQLTFCADVEIPHFIIDLNRVIHGACSDTFLYGVVIFFTAILLAIGPLVSILYFYSKIVSSMHAISSAQERHKVFSTCTSHLLVVSLFYCTCIGVYLSSSIMHKSHSTVTTSVMYTVVTPMLSPFIYSLRNKDIKSALKRLLGNERRKLPVILRLNK